MSAAAELFVVLAPALPRRLALKLAGSLPIVA
jgi:hypothetical protein